MANPNQQTINECETKLNAISNEISTKIGSQISVSVDWEFFLNSPAFSKYDVNYYEVVTEITRLADLTKDSIAKNAIATRIQKVVFRYHPDNAVNGYGSYKHYDVKLENTTLYITVNLDKWNNDLYSFEEKMDPVLTLRVPKGIRDATESISKLQQEFNTKVGKTIPIEVDWNAFVNHPNFLSRELPQHTSIIQYLYQSHIPRTMTNSGGLADMCTKDPINKQAVADRINKVVFAFDPESKQDGVGSYKHYDVKLVDGVLRITANLDKWNNDLYSFEDKMDPVLNLRVAKGIQKATEAIQKLQKELEQKVQKNIPIEVDWGFTTHQFFLNRELAQYTTVIEYMYNYHIPRTMTNSGGLGDLCSREPVFKEAIQQRVQKVVFTYDPENKQDGVGSYKHYDVKLVDGVLRITVNLDKWNYDLYSFEDKMDPVLNLRVAKGIQKATEAIQKLQQELEQKVQKKIPIEVDWTFTTHQFFLNRELAQYTSVIEYMYNYHIPRTMTNSGGLGDLCSKDVIFKEAIQQRVEKVLFTYDPENKQDGYGSYKHYDVKLVDGVLRVTVNLDKWNYDLYSFEEKMDPVLNLRVAKAVRDADVKIMEVQKQISQKLNKDIHVTVLWDAFVNHPNFRNRELSQYTSIISYLYDYHIPRTITNSGGLVDLATKDQIFMDAVHLRIHGIVFVYDPESKQDGYGSYKHYDVKLDNGNLYITINLDKWNYDLYSFEDKMDPVLNLRIPKAIRDSFDEIKKAETELEKAVGKKIPIDVYWANFVRHPFFLNRELPQYTSIIQYMYQYHIPRTMINSGGLADMAKRDEIVKTSVLERIQAVYFSYDPENHQDGYGSYKHYDVRLVDGILYITVNLDKWNYDLYSFEDKMDPVLNLRVQKGMRDAAQNIQKNQQELSTKVGKEIPIQVDWTAFVQHPTFLNRELAQYTSIIEYMYNYHIPRTMTNSGGSMADKDPIVKEVILDRIEQVIFRYDPESKQEGYGSYKHYDVKLFDGILLITVNLDKWNYDLYSFEEKMDPVLNLRVAQGMRDAKKAIVPLMEELNKKATKKIPIEIDFDHFVNHPNFLNRELAQYTSIIQYMYNYHIPRTMTNSGGLGDLCQRDDIFRQAVMMRINSVTFTFDPESKQDGYGSYKHYNVKLKKGTLHVTVNLDKWNYDLYSFEEKMDLVLNLRIAQGMRDTSNKIQKIEDQMNQALFSSNNNQNNKKKISLEVDFMKFVNHEVFLKRELPQYTSVINYLGDYHVPRIISYSGGLMDLCKQDDIFYNAVTTRIRRVVFYYDPESKQEGYGSYKHYDVKLKNFALHVAINLDKWNYDLYSFSDKIDPVLNLRIPQGVRDTRKRLDNAEKTAEGHLGKKIKLDVDWDSFVNHWNFLKRELPQYTSVIDNITNDHFSRFVSALQSLGGDKSKFNSSVSTVVFRYDPENKVDDSNHSYKYYEVILYGNTQEMIITLNLDHWNYSIYSMEEKIKKALGSPKNKEVKKEQEVHFAQSQKIQSGINAAPAPTFVLPPQPQEDMENPAQKAQRPDRPIAPTPEPAKPVVQAQPVQQPPQQKPVEPVQPPVQPAQQPAQPQQRPLPQQPPQQKPVEPVKPSVQQPATEPAKPAVQPQQPPQQKPVEPVKPPVQPQQPVQQPPKVVYPELGQKPVEKTPEPVQQPQPVQQPEPPKVAPQPVPEPVSAVAVPPSAVEDGDPFRSTSPFAIGGPQDYQDKSKTNNQMMILLNITKFKMIELGLTGTISASISLGVIGFEVSVSKSESLAQASQVQTQLTSLEGQLMGALQDDDSLSSGPATPATSASSATTSPTSVKSKFLDSISKMLSGLKTKGRRMLSNGVSGSVGASVGFGMFNFEIELAVEVELSSIETTSTEEENTGAGILCILLISGAKLPAKDRNGKSDPYCIIEAGMNQVKSRVIKKTLDPVWNEKLYLEASIDDLLSVKVFDSNVIERDQIMGEQSFSLKDLKLWDGHPRDLIVREGLEGGEVHMRAVFKFYNLPTNLNLIKQLHNAPNMQIPAEPATAANVLPDLFMSPSPLTNQQPKNFKEKSALHKQLMIAVTATKLKMLTYGLSGSVSANIKLGIIGFSVGVSKTVTETIEQLQTKLAKLETDVTASGENDQGADSGNSGIMIPTQASANNNSGNTSILKKISAHIEEMLSGVKTKGTRLRMNGYTGAIGANITLGMFNFEIGIAVEVEIEAIEITEVDNSRGNGVLYIELQNGTNLPAKNKDGTSDPYCIFACGMNQVKSKVIKKTLNPTWNQVLEIPANIDNELVVKAFDHNTIEKDKPMGEHRFSLKFLGLFNGAAKDLVFKEGQGLERGEIKFRAVFKLQNTFSNKQLYKELTGLPTSVVYNEPGVSPFNSRSPFTAEKNSNAGGSEIENQLLLALNLAKGKMQEWGVTGSITAGLTLGVIGFEITLERSFAESNLQIQTQTELLSQQIEANASESESTSQEIVPASSGSSTSMVSNKVSDGMGNIFSGLQSKARRMRASGYSGSVGGSIFFGLFNFEISLAVNLTLEAMEGTMDDSMDAEPGSGVLTIFLSKGSGLPAKDRGGTSDPYCVFANGVSQAKSAVIKKNLNPTWNEIISMEANINQPLTVTVYDHNKIQKDSLIGRQTFLLKDLGMHDGRPRDLVAKEGLEAGQVFFKAVFKFYQSDGNIQLMKDMAAATMITSSS